MWILKLTLKNATWILVLNISSQTFSTPRPPSSRGCWHDMWRRRAAISRRSTKASNDLGEGLAAWSHVKFVACLVSIKSRHASYLCLVTHNQQPLQQSRVFQMTSFLKLPWKWSDSWERAGAEDHVTQGCQMAPTLVFPRWENHHDHTACKGHVALTSVCLVDCQGIASCLRGWEDMLSLPYYSV